MTRSNLSAHSSSPRPYHRHRGFAVVEVMMSVILVVIGTTLAFPSYRDMVQKRQLSQTTELLSSSANTAQVISAPTRQPEAAPYPRIEGNDGCIGTMEYQDLLF